MNTLISLIEIGRRYLASIHFFTLVYPFIPLFGYNAQFCCSIAETIVVMNQDSKIKHFIIIPRNVS